MFNLGRQNFFGGKGAVGGSGAQDSRTSTLFDGLHFGVPKILTKMPQNGDLLKIFQETWFLKDHATLSLLK